MKQLITISSGSILLMLTFWEKVFTQHLWKASVAFVGLLICIIAAVIMMRTISLKMGAGYKPEAAKKFQKTEDWAFPFAAGAFLVAILALVVFVIRNLLVPLV
jgi:zinc transporter ZupT